MREDIEDHKIAFETWVERNTQYHPELKLLFGVDDGTESTVFLPVPRGGYHGMFICFDIHDHDWLLGVQEQAYFVVPVKVWTEASSNIVRYLT